MFKATVSDARFWKNLLSAISTLVEEADFNIISEGIKLRSMDPSHVAMVDFEWPKESFSEYECQKPIKIRINLNGLLKLLKRVKSDETLLMSYNEELKKIDLMLKNKIVKKFTIPTLESSDEETPTPKIDFTSTVKLTANTFKDIIDDAQEVSDNVRLETLPDQFIINASTELSHATFEINKESEALLDLEVKEPSKATFNLNYLQEMVKAGLGTSEIISLQFSTNMPLKIEFLMPQKGRLLYYLAPRIEAD